MIPRYQAHDGVFLSCLLYSTCWPAVKAVIMGCFSPASVSSCRNQISFDLLNSFCPSRHRGPSKHNTPFLAMANTTVEIPSEQLELLRRAFSVFDRIGVGSVSPAELEAVFTAINQDVPAPALQAMISYVDEEQTKGPNKSPEAYTVDVGDNIRRNASDPSEIKSHARRGPRTLYESFQQTLQQVRV